MQKLSHYNRKISCFSQRVVYRYCIVISSLLTLLFAMASQTHADVVESLYEVEIPIVDQKVKTRRAVFNQGLREVLIRVTGDSNIFSLIKLPSSSSSYVKQFQYHDFEKEDKARFIENADASSNVKPKIPTQMLWVQFNETKVNDFVRNNALPLWGEHRDKAVIWLAVNDGVNRYVLKRLDESLLKKVTNDAATRRAIPVIWPDVSREEQPILFADVWVGFEQSLRKLSNSYTKGPIIVGRLVWQGEQWNSEWTLFLGDNRTDWVIEDADYTKLLPEAIETAADTMGQQFALFDTGDAKSFHSLDIQINEVNSIVALNDLKKYLSSLPMVQQLRLELIENQRVFFDMSLRTNTEDFLDYLQKDSKLLLVPDNKKIDKELQPIVQNDLTAGALKTADTTKSNSIQNEIVQTISKAAAYQFQFQP